MRQHTTPLVTIANLWLKERPDGRFHLTGRLGPTRIVIRPIDGAAAGEPQYVCQIAETDSTLQPGESR